MELHWEAFNGQVEPLTQFIRSNWKKLYAERGPYLLWGEDLFGWQLQQKLTKAAWDLSIIAYRNGKIVGCVLGFPFYVNLQNQKYKANWMSWVTVAHDAQEGGHGLSFRLLDKFVQQSIKRGVDIIFGLSQVSQTSRYWKAYFRFARKTLPLFHESGSAGTGQYRMKVLDQARFDNWVGLAGNRQLGVDDADGDFLGPAGTNASVRVRPFEPNDAAACAAIYALQNCGATFYREWAISEWSSQLLGSFATATLILEIDGKVAGFINYYFCEMWGGERAVGVANVAHFCITPKLALDFAEPLLCAAEKRWRQAGVVAALLPDLHYFPQINYEPVGYYLLSEQFQLFYGNFNPRMQLPEMGKVAFDNV